MIAQLRGTILETNLEKDSLRVVIEVQGVGYEVWMTRATEGRIVPGQDAVILVSESVTAFDGATTLYGFATREEKEFFSRIRHNVDGMGPKKALECLDKISKSMPDFKRAVIDGDLSLLVSVFGFSKKTAEKLVLALKEKMETWAVAGPVKWQQSTRTTQDSEVLNGLLNLGYREDEARELLQRAKANTGASAGTEVLLKEALKLMGAKI